MKKWIHGKSLKISAGQYSDKGRKESNQDFHGLYVPKEPQLSAKGIAVALADGISSSQVSQVAAQSAVTGFLEDYYCTSEAWSVRTSAERVLAATNSWLHSQTQQSQHRYDKDRGYVCTFSGMIIKSTTAHLFHVGDTRIYRLRDHELTQLTEDHRVWVSSKQSYLARALGIDRKLDIDYQPVQLEMGDVFLLATDGVYEYIDADFIIATIDACGGDLDGAAKRIVEEAYEQGSGDNLTLQIVRIDELPTRRPTRFSGRSPNCLSSAARTARQFRRLPDRSRNQGQRRSHIYLAVDSETGESVVIKTPSIDLQADPASSSASCSKSGSPAASTAPTSSSPASRRGSATTSTSSPNSSKARR